MLGDQLQAVLDPVVDLLQQDLALLDAPRAGWPRSAAARSPCPAGWPHPAGRRCRARRTRPRIRLSTSSTPNGLPSPCRITFIARRMPFSSQELGRAEALLVLEMVRDHRLAGAQREAGRRGQVGADLGARRRRPGASRRRPGPAGGLRPAGAPAPCRTRRRAPRRRAARSGRAARRTACPCSASTPSSARISCWRMRCRSARWLSSPARSPSGWRLDHRRSRRIGSASRMARLIRLRPSAASGPSTRRPLPHGMPRCRRGKCSIFVRSDRRAIA